MPSLPAVFTAIPVSAPRPTSALSTPAMQVDSGLDRGFLLLVPLRGEGLSAAIS